MHDQIRFGPFYDNIISPSLPYHGDGVHSLNVFHKKRKEEKKQLIEHERPQKEQTACRTVDSQPRVEQP